MRVDQPNNPLIDKTAAVNTLIQLKGEALGLMASVYDTCIKAIQEVPEHDPWTKIEDGPPKPLQDVIVHTAFGYVGEAWMDKDGRWYRSNYGEDLALKRITHWMPKPQPPKEAHHVKG